MHVVVTVSSSPNLVDYVRLNTLDIFHAFPSCLLPSSSSDCYNLSPIDSYVVFKGNAVDCFKSVGNFRGYGLSLDPCSLYLEDMLGKFTWAITFQYSTKFSKALVSLGEHLLLFLDSCLSALTYIHLSCMLKCSITFCEL